MTTTSPGEGIVQDIDEDPTRRHQRRATLLDEEDVALYLQADTSALANALRTDAPLMAAEVLRARKDAAEMVAVLRAAGLRGDSLRALVVRAADEVRRLQALLDVPYRPGLPSAEVAQRHFEANGPGRWQRRYVHSRDGVLQMLMMQADEGGLHLWRQSGRMDRPIEDDDFYEYRPCLPNGTACPWPVQP